MENDQNTPSRRRFPMTWVLALLVVILAISLVVTLGFLLSQRGAEPELLQPAQTLSANEAIPGNVAIPGFEYLDLQADTARQKLALGNPDVNDCLFQLTLMLEDGTVLWVSEDIRPGAQSEPIVLTQPLAAGEYGAVLHYQCYSMGLKRTALNAAQIGLTLRVK